MVQGGDNWAAVDEFFDKMDKLHEEQILEDLFNNDAWQSFVESGYYPYNFGFNFYFFYF